MKKIVIALVGISLPLLGISEEKQEQCSKEVLISFFPKPFVSKMLDKYKVDEDLRESIVDDLTNRDTEVLTTIDSRAEAMGFNPLKDSTKRKEAMVLFNQVLNESFVQVMQAHGITNEELVQEMYVNIQRQKSDRFRKCREMRGRKP